MSSSEILLSNPGMQAHFPVVPTEITQDFGFGRAQHANQLIKVTFQKFLSSPSSESFSNFMHIVDDFGQCSGGEIDSTPYLDQLIDKVKALLFDKCGIFAQYVTLEHLEQLPLLERDEKESQELNNLCSIGKDLFLLQTSKDEKALKNYKNKLEAYNDSHPLISFLKKTLPYVGKGKEEKDLIVLILELYVKEMIAPSDHREYTLPQELQKFVVNIGKTQEEKLLILEAAIDYFSSLFSQDTHPSLTKALYELTREFSSLKNLPILDCCKEKELTGFILPFLTIPNDLQPDVLEDLIAHGLNYNSMAPFFPIKDSLLFANCFKEPLLRFDQKKICEILKNLSEDTAVFFPIALLTIKEEIQHIVSKIEQLQKENNLQKANENVSLLDTWSETLALISLNVPENLQQSVEDVRMMCVLFLKSNLSQEPSSSATLAPFTWYSECSKTWESTPLIPYLHEVKRQLEKNEFSLDSLMEHAKKVPCAAHPRCDPNYKIVLSPSNNTHLLLQERGQEGGQEDEIVYQIPYHHKIELYAKSLLKQAIALIQKNTGKSSYEIIKQLDPNYTCAQIFIERQYEGVETYPDIEEHIKTAFQNLENSKRYTRRSSLFFLFYLVKKNAFSKEFFKLKSLSIPKLARMAHFAKYTDEKERFFFDLCTMRFKDLFRTQETPFAIDPPENDCVSNSLIRMIIDHGFLDIFKKAVRELLKTAVEKAAVWDMKNPKQQKTLDEIKDIFSNFDEAFIRDSLALSEKDKKEILSFLQQEVSSTVDLLHTTLNTTHLDLFNLFEIPLECFYSTPNKTRLELFNLFEIPIGINEEIRALPKPSGSLHEVYTTYLEQFFFLEAYRKSCPKAIFSQESEDSYNKLRTSLENSFSQIFKTAFEKVKQITPSSQKEVFELLELLQVFDEKKIRSFPRTTVFRQDLLLDQTFSLLESLLNDLKTHLQCDVIDIYERYSLVLGLKETIFAYKKKILSYLDSDEHLNELVLYTIRLSNLVSKAPSDKDLLHTIEDLQYEVFMTMIPCIHLPRDEKLFVSLLRHIHSVKMPTLCSELVKRVSNLEKLSKKTLKEIKSFSNNFSTKTLYKLFRAFPHDLIDPKAWPLDEFFHMALETNDKEVLNSLLPFLKDLPPKNKNGSPLLLEAYYRGNQSIVQKLLESGFDPSLKDASKKSLEFFRAIEEKNWPLVSVLCKNIYGDASDNIVPLIIDQDIFSLIMKTQDPSYAILLPGKDTLEEKLFLFLEEKVKGLSLKEQLTLIQQILSFCTFTHTYYEIEPVRLSTIPISGNHIDELLQKKITHSSIPDAEKNKRGQNIRWFLKTIFTNKVEGFMNPETTKAKKFYEILELYLKNTVPLLESEKDTLIIEKVLSTYADTYGLCSAAYEDSIKEMFFFMKRTKQKDISYLKFLLADFREQLIKNIVAEQDRAYVIDHPEEPSRRHNIHNFRHAIQFLNIGLINSYDAHDVDDAFLPEESYDEGAIKKAFETAHTPFNVFQYLIDILRSGDQVLLDQYKALWEEMVPEEWGIETWKDLSLYKELKAELDRLERHPDHEKETLKKLLSQTILQQELDAPEELHATEIKSYLQKRRASLYYEHELEDHMPDGMRLAKPLPLLKLLFKQQFIKMS